MRNARNFLCGVTVLVSLLSQAGLVWAVGFDSSALYPEAPDYTAGEAELLETLRSGEPAKKAVACKQLAIHGSKNAVPELAKLLHDEQLASWARIALEAIPDAAADQALLKAAESLKGQLLVGTINSIGVRRSAGAVEALSGRLKDGDAEVASAAAVALGRIGDDDATTALRAALKNSPADVRSAVAEGCILCAERLAAEGKSDEAAEIYDEVRRAELPKQRVLEATRGAIVARGPAGVPLLVEQLRASDKSRFQMALATARELPGSEVAEALAAEVTRTAPDRAALVLHAFADRPGAVLLPAVIEAANSGDKQVRIAAIGVVGRLGDAASVPTLLEIAENAEAEIAQSAKTAIAGLPGDEVDAALASRLDSAEGKSLAVLLELVGQRRIEATPALVQALDHPDETIRGAALIALGETVAPKDLSVLIAQVVEPTNSGDAEIAARALQAAAVRMPDREAAAAELAAAMPRASTATKATLLKILGAMGGQKALETIADTVKGGDAALQDAGTRVLGEWMTADAAPVLLGLATDPANKKYQVRALRGYLRLARQFAATDAERAEMCRQALAAATRPEEQRLVLEVLERYPSAETLAVATEAAKSPALRDEATRVAKVITDALAKQGDDSAGSG